MRLYCSPACESDTRPAPQTLPPVSHLKHKGLASACSSSCGTVAPWLHSLRVADVNTCGCCIAPKPRITGWWGPCLCPHPPGTLQNAHAGWASTPHPTTAGSTQMCGAHTLHVSTALTSGLLSSLVGSALDTWCVCPSCGASCRQWWRPVITVEESSQGIGMDMQHPR